VKDTFYLRQDDRKNAVLNKKKGFFNIDASVNIFRPLVIAGGESCFWMTKAARAVLSILKRSE